MYWMTGERTEDVGRTWMSIEQKEQLINDPMREAAAKEVEEARKTLNAVIASDKGVEFYLIMVRAKLNKLQEAVDELRKVENQLIEDMMRGLAKQKRGRPYSNLSDETTAAEATVDIEKLGEAFNRQIRKSLTKQNAKNLH